MKTEIVRCEKCDTINRIYPHPDRFDSICEHCGASIKQNISESTNSKSHPVSQSNVSVRILLLVLLSVTIYGIIITPSYLKKDFTYLTQEEVEKTQAIREQYDNQYANQRATLEKELATIDATALRQTAIGQYNRELAGRKSYDKRFALSQREKAQLQMKALASDSTKSYHEAIRLVAMEASPKGANIRVRESPQGISLHIDFDMSSMTSGEHGTRTKHDTKDSLRKEVVFLISRVTNDIFQFCKDFSISSIHVGCQHYVTTTNQYGSSRDENMMLYKIRIQKNRISELISSPFLDVYSTKKYFEVDEDNFDDIEITVTRL